MHILTYICSYSCIYIYIYIYPGKDEYMPLRSELSSHIHNRIQIHIIDDANAALKGEKQSNYRSCSGSICMITIGTGIGTSVIISGTEAVYTGSRGLVEGGIHTHICIYTYKYIYIYIYI